MGPGWTSVAVDGTGRVGEGASVGAGAGVIGVWILVPAGQTGGAVVIG